MPLRTATALGSTPRPVTYTAAPSTATVVSSVHTVKGQKTASGLGKSCARGGTRTGRQPLKNRHSPENIPNPPRSAGGTTESEVLCLGTWVTVLFQVNRDSSGVLGGDTFADLIGG
jgi:hypothetical protein